jgi:hypothetical protein
VVVAELSEEGWQSTFYRLLQREEEIGERKNCLYGHRIEPAGIGVLEWDGGTDDCAGSGSRRGGDHTGSYEPANHTGGDEPGDYTGSYESADHTGRG